MSQLLDHDPPPKLIAVSSPYRGYAPYDDIKYNLAEAREILKGYRKPGEYPISLPLQWPHLGLVPASDHETHSWALAGCLEIISRVDALHIYYPRGGHMSRGQRLEWERARQLGIEIVEREREW